jgi:hypothetical protein
VDYGSRASSAERARIGAEPIEIGSGEAIEMRQQKRVQARQSFNQIQESDCPNLLE